MLSYAFSTASTYFHLPVDEQEDQDIAQYYRKRITYSSPAYSTASPDFVSLPSTAPSTHRDAVLDAIIATDDLYAILGVSKADKLDKLSLRRAYLKRSRACHPDKFPDNPQATHAFQKIAVAYSILQNPTSRRSYDMRSPKYDVFSTHSSGHMAQETFRGIIMGVLDDFLEGDLEMIRTLLRAVNDINPSLSMGDEGINSILNSLQRLRERALSPGCRACVYALYTEMSRLLELQHSFRQLSYLDIRGRTRLTIQLTRVTLSLPIALERALIEQNASYNNDNTDPPLETIIPRRVTVLIRGVDVLLQRMERVL
ncbi:J domain-containing protein [Mycena indigotica]|uniref:J domain-containing protein n=1 Tax=Mycena indigotica TaxID=2126181 RepID=A0A8H6T7E0_9AGAR|nr:J domain-containing protein [Mycena indigotica]KAF7312154.1 J domain-containing protein [Mycena indigotica]